MEGNVMNVLLRAAVLGLAASLSAATAFAADEADELMPGRILLIRSGILAKFIAKPATTFDLPDSANDPTLEGASLSVFDTAGAASDTFPLPAGGWKGLGSPAGSKGYKYKGLGSIADPCRVVLVKSNIVKATCKGAGINLPTPFSGDAGIVLAVGTDTKTYCAQFGGVQVRNDPAQLKKKTAPAPGACPTPGGGTSTTTSTTATTSNTGGSSTSTSSSTLPPGPCCGNDANFVAFTNGVGSGACGSFTNANGTQFDTLDCGGLYFGGGQNSVPLPAITPDFTSSVTSVVSCVGQSATLGASTSTDTGDNLRCSDVGCFFGGPLPIPNTASTPTSTCVINSVAQPASGTLDCASGAAHIDLPLNSEIFLVGDSLPAEPGIQPCPLCSGGTPNVLDSGLCQGGINNGMACTPSNSMQNTAYPTSHDCPPLVNLSIGTIPIGFALDSGTVSWTATSAPNPTSNGSGGVQARVFCGYCRDGATLGFQQPFQPCWENGGPLGPACAFGVEPVCQQRNQGAFGPNGESVRTITAVGAPAGPLVDGLPHAQNLVSVFCIPPTFNATIDAAANLPGPGAVAFNGEIETCAAGTVCPE
jgi:hypothetical protein